MSEVPQVGPCSIHDPKAAMEYAGRLVEFAKEVWPLQPCALSARPRKISGFVIPDSSQKLATFRSIPGGGRPLLREGGPISYQPTHDPPRQVPIDGAEE